MADARRENAAGGVPTNGLAAHDRARAADKPRQLFEPAAHTIRDQIDQPVFEHKRQLAAAAFKMGGGQHTRPAAEIRCATRKAAPRMRALSSIGGVTSSHTTGDGSLTSFNPA